MMQQAACCITRMVSAALQHRPVHAQQRFYRDLPPNDELVLSLE